MDNYRQNNRNLIDESFRKGELLKKSLKIVDELGKLDPDDYGENDDLVKLINDAIKLKKNKYWKLY